MTQPTEIQIAEDYDFWYAEARARTEGPPDPEPPDERDVITDDNIVGQIEWPERNESLACSCVPCESPANGAPGIAHCAACCSGSLIEEYDHECPVPEHRDMAEAQFGPEPDYEQILEDQAIDRDPDPEAIMWGGEDIPS